ncbi:gametogenetin [Eublepharis macularius]|uniref:Gametogenetin n=1 Tax=Eublepharis macularius TaxID=481883 RepID=A0AA97LGV3_EUBMA|nr:gametogenetin [Eublepharis macularius]
MGNVQWEATQESEATKDGEEKANPDRSKTNQRSSATKQETGCLSLNPWNRKGSSQPMEPEDVCQPQGNEPGGGDRQAGATEMEKSHSKKSKPKQSSTWAQNSPSGAIKEASLCDKELKTERQGLACLSGADLQTGQNTGSVLQEDQKGLKPALKPPQVVASDPKDLGARRAAAKGKSKAENACLGKNPASLSLQPEKIMELGLAIAADEDGAETKVYWAQRIKASPKDEADHEEPLPESVPCGQKVPTSSLRILAPFNMTEDTLVGLRFMQETDTNRPAPSSGAASPGGKKALLLWGSGQWEIEQMGQRDNTPGSDGDSKGPAPASHLLAEHPTMSSSLVETCPASGSEAEAGAKNEAAGAEVVSSETMQELLERGLNFLYKVTIQPGQWPPSIKAVKPKAGLIPSGISYADVLKQCPQKKAPASTLVLPQALHHLTTPGKKLPSFKGLEGSNPEDFSSLSQLFLEHFKKVTPKEPAGHAPGQPVVTFLEELSTAGTKRPEWQRPRPPTPYPQRRKGQGRKLPKFGAAVPQVVTFLGSDAKCDWLVHDESQMSFDAADAAAEEEGMGPTDPSQAGDQEAVEAASSPSIAALLSEQEIAVEVDGSVQRLCWRSLDLPEGAKETGPLKSPPCNSAWGTIPPLATGQSFQTEDRPPTPLPGPKSYSPSETPKAPSPTGSPMGPAPTRPSPGKKATGTAQARPKVRKQGPAAAKSKEKLKSSGQPKVKVPKGKGQKQWPRSCGVASPLKLEGVPLFPPFEKVARPFYFGEPLEVPPSLDERAAIEEDATLAQNISKQDQEGPSPVQHRQWPAFQVADSCSRKCYCRHQEERKLPKNIVAWLNPSTNHLAEPPWVATALLAVSLVAGSKFCLDSYKQQHVTREDLAPSSKRPS